MGGSGRLKGMSGRGVEPQGPKKGRRGLFLPLFDGDTKIQSKNSNSTRVEDKQGQGQGG